MRRPIATGLVVLGSVGVSQGQAPAPRPLVVSMQATCRVVSPTEVEVRRPDGTVQAVPIPAAGTGGGARGQAAAGLLQRPVVTLRSPQGSGPMPPAPSLDAGGLVRGIDDNGQPYIEERLPDGTVRRFEPHRFIETRPGADPVITTSNRSLPMETRIGTPPDLPSDPLRGRNWISRHNQRLLELIRRLVRNDQQQLDRLAEAERNRTGGDLYQQLEYRTEIADFLIGAR